MKHSTGASLLSFIVPGAGSWYCGWRRLAVGNLLMGVVIPGSALFWKFSSEHIQWVILAVGASSAGFAHAMSGVRQEGEDEK